MVPLGAGAQCSPVLGGRPAATPPALIVCPPTLTLKPACLPAEVVEVVRYRGPVNATIIRRHQQWLDAAQTRSARHKIAKFLKQHAVLAASKGLAAPGACSAARAPLRA